MSAPARVPFTLTRAAVERARMAQAGPPMVVVVHYVNDWRPDTHPPAAGDERTTPARVVVRYVNDWRADDGEAK